MVLCQLRQIENAITPDEDVAGREVRASAPSHVALAQAPAGELAGPNPMRTGFYLHNATDGTLLVRFGEGEATPESYTVPIGPGAWYSTDGVVREQLVKGRIGYAWVTEETDVADYPAGTFPAATAGALAYTELALKR